MPFFMPELDYGYGELKSLVLHLSALTMIGIFGYSLISDGKTNRRVSAPSELSLNSFVRQPHRMILLGVAGLVIATAIATLFSPLPKVSFFGGYEEYSGFSLYDTISLSLLCFGAFFCFRTSRDFSQLFMVLAGTGALVSIYGLAQHFGWDALGEREHSNRILSSFGNTLNFGAFLTITIPATLAIAITRSTPSRSAMAVIGVGLGIQIAALWLTGGRGPLIGTFVGTFLTIGAVALTRDAILVKRIGIAFGIGVVVSAGLLFIPAGDSVDTLGRVSSIDRELSALTGEDISLGSGGLQARQKIWRTSIDMFLDPVSPDSENSLLTQFRRVFGVGPEMYVHSYSLANDPVPGIKLQSNAHNIFLHLLVTLGLLGILSLVVLGSGLVGTTFGIARRLSLPNVDNAPLLVIAGVLAAIVLGKSVEMLVGIPRISDLLPTFVVVGGVSAAVVGSSISRFDEAKSSSEIAAKPAFGVGRSSIAAVVAVVFIVGLAVFVAWDLRRFSGTVEVATSNSNPELLGDAFISAQGSVPDRLFYGSIVANLYIDAASERIQEGETDEALALLGQAHAALAKYQNYNPHEFLVQLALAKVTALLVQNGSTEHRQEMVERYRVLAENNPGYPTIVGTAATAAATGGEFDLAIELATRAIATEESTKNWSKAWFARGVSRYTLGQHDEGISDLLTAIEKEPASQSALLSHQALVQIYTEIGDTESAEFHRSQLRR